MQDYEDDDDDFELDERCEMELEERDLLDNFGPYSVQLAKFYIDKFFKDKRMHYGGSIPLYMLHDIKRLSMVLNTKIIDAVDVAYQALEKDIDPKELRKAEKSGAVTKDIILVYKTLNEIAKCRIPQPFAGGILLTYLELCEGAEF